ncbi:MAG: hypothetical protein OEV78_02330 [Spirochaetia bacterium]|nr:hypothetical protein [Spirochaetia bacterium]
MNFLTEEDRIIDKIQNKKTFQTESWQRLYYIFEVLKNAGFHMRGDFAVNNSKSIGWQYYLVNKNNDLAHVLATEFIGEYIQVEFRKL